MLFPLFRIFMKIASMISFLWNCAQSLNQSGPFYWTNLSFLLLIYVLVRCFAKNKVLVLKLFWSILMGVLGQQLWLMLPTAKDPLWTLKICSVSATRSMGTLMLIVLRNFVPIARGRETLSKNTIFTLRIVKLEHSRLLLSFLQPQGLMYMPLLHMLSLPSTFGRKLLYTRNGTANANFNIICNGDSR